MRKGKVVLVQSLLFLFSFKGYSQGCSDAGVCTAGSLHPEAGTDSTQRKFLIAFAPTIAIGEESTLILSPEIDVNWYFISNTALQLKLPYHFISGDLASANGIGDISLNLSRRFVLNSKSSLDGLLGARIPTGRSDEISDNVFLPMTYQHSLGTLDLLAGIKYSLKSWQFSLGYQHPVINNNENRYYDEHLHEYPEKEDSAFFYSYFLDRKPDAIARVAYQWQFNKLQLTPSLLAIYHLANDEVQTNDGELFEATGSQGLTLNAVVNLAYRISERASIGLAAGVPIIVRDVRPDGLTRMLVVTPSFSLRF